MSEEFKVELQAVTGNPQVEARISLTLTQFEQCLALYLDSRGKTIHQLETEALQKAVFVLRNKADEIQSYLERRNL